MGIWVVWLLIFKKSLNNIKFVQGFFSVKTKEENKNGGKINDIFYSSSWLIFKLVLTNLTTLKKAVFIVVAIVPKKLVTFSSVVASVVTNDFSSIFSSICGASWTGVVAVCSASSFFS